jgi:hypothetical protein
MIRSEKPTFELRSTALTMGDRFTSASTCSTLMRALDKTRLKRRSASVKSRPFGFFRLISDDVSWGIALKPSILAHEGVFE